MPLDAIAIPTARRHSVLARCIASYADNARRYGRAPRFLIGDDATDECEQQASREAVSALATTYRGTFTYLGLSDKLAFARRLIRTAGVSPEAIAFAFFDMEGTRLETNGANRNLLFAFAAGDSLLMVDDDTVCETYRPPNHDASRTITCTPDSTPRDPSEYWPLLASDAGRDVCRPEAVDCLGEHERWLQHGVVSANGLLGDCGWGNPLPYLFWRGASLARLTASNAVYDESVTNRLVVRAVSSPTLCSRTDDFMSTFFALDGRTLLPPFSPIGRGSDRVFAKLLSVCCPEARFAHLPLVLAHRPLQARRFWRGEIMRSAAGIDFSMLLCALLDTLRPQAGDRDDSGAVPTLGGAAAGTADADARFAWCGDALIAIAGGDADTFAACASAAVRNMLAEQIVELDAAAASPDIRADHFRRDASAYASALRQTCARDDFFVPLDLRTGRTEADARVLTQKLVRRVGELVHNWPAIATAARALAGAGDLSDAR